MASAIFKQPCVRCEKGGGILTCVGCYRWFCTKHLLEHRQELAVQMDLIGQEHDILQRDFSQDNDDHHPLLTRINEWEEKSMKTIRTIAEKARNDLQEYIVRSKTQLRTLLIGITTEIQTSQGSKDYTEIELNKWNEQLKQLRESFEKSITVDIIENDQTPLTISSIQVKQHQIINQISTPLQEMSIKTTSPRSVIGIGVNDVWLKNAVTIAGGYGPGNKLHQLYGPHGIYINRDKTLFIADNDNHRIVKWEFYSTAGVVIAGGKGRGNTTDRLDNPIDIVFHNQTNSIIICDRNNRRVMQWSRQNRIDGTVILTNISCQGLAVDDEGFLYVSDFEKHEVRRYRIGESTGEVVAGGHGKGQRLNQLNYPTSICVDANQSVYVSDSNNNRIMKWAKDSKEGVIVAGGQGLGSTLSQLSNPRGIAMDLLGRVYVVDGWNHRVVRWSNGMTQGELIVGGNDQGNQANQLNYPESLMFDHEGNLYVADCLNHRIQRFDIRKNLL